MIFEYIYRVPKQLTQFHTGSFLYASIQGSHKEQVRRISGRKRDSDRLIFIVV